MCTPPPLKMAYRRTWERAKGTVHPLLCPSNFVSLTYLYIFLLVSTKWSKSHHMREICALRPSPPNLRVHNVMPWYYLNLSFVLILVSVVGGDSTKPIILSRIIQSKLLSPFRLAAHHWVTYNSGPLGILCYHMTHRALLIAQLYELFCWASLLCTVFNGQHFVVCVLFVCSWSVGSCMQWRERALAQCPVVCKSATGSTHCTLRARSSRATVLRTCDYE